MDFGGAGLSEAEVGIVDLTIDDFLNSRFQRKVFF
jgi:hypothetical protein